MKKKQWGIALVVLLALAVIGYNYLYQDHKDIATSKVDIETTATAILDNYELDITQSDQQYLDKVIVVKGKITESDSEGITLDDAVFIEGVVAGEKGSIVTYKARCIGYDDLIGIVKMDQATKIK